MLDKKLLLEKANAYYEKSYFLMEKDFMNMVKECEVAIPNSKVAIEAFKRGYEQGLTKGKEDAFKMKENADGCAGCAFYSTEPWEMPCKNCSRGNKDYWRAKRTLAEMEK